MKESQMNKKINLYPKDFEDIKKYNPENSDGCYTIFDDTIPIEIRVENEENKNKIGIIEKINIKIFKRVN